MKIKGLDGKIYNWQLGQHIKESANSSSYHEKVRAILKELFPVSVICEEVPLPGSGTHMLIADFVLPHRKLVIEIHGRQHYEHIGHFHGTDTHGKLKFLKGQGRDRTKKNWCELNNLTLLELSYEETEDVWRNKIRQG